MNIMELQSALHNMNLVLGYTTNDLAKLGLGTAGFGSDNSIKLCWDNPGYSFLIDFYPDHSVSVYYCVDGESEVECWHTSVEPVVESIRTFIAGVISK